MCPVTVLDDPLEFLGWSPLSLHFCGIKENPHLRLGAGFVKGNRVENVVSIFLQGPIPPERVIARSSNKGMESIRTLAGDLKALVGIQDIYGGIVPEVWRKGAERQLNFQISRQGLDFILAGNLFIFRDHCDREQ